MTNSIPGERLGSSQGAQGSATQLNSSPASNVDLGEVEYFQPEPPKTTFESAINNIRDFISNIANKLSRIGDVITNLFTNPRVDPSSTSLREDSNRTNDSNLPTHLEDYRDGGAVIIVNYEPPSDQPASVASLSVASFDGGAIIDVNYAPPDPPGVLYSTDGESAVYSNHTFDDISTYLDKPLETIEEERTVKDLGAAFYEFNDDATKIIPHSQSLTITKSNDEQSDVDAADFLALVAAREIDRNSDELNIIGVGSAPIDEVAQKLNLTKDDILNIWISAESDALDNDEYQNLIQGNSTPQSSYEAGAKLVDLKTENRKSNIIELFNQNNIEIPEFFKR